MINKISQLSLFWYEINNIGFVFSLEGKPEIPLNGFYSVISTSCKRGYIGEYKNGLMHGRGVIFDTIGRMYQGDFKRGRLHGIGTLFFQKEDNEKHINIDNFPFWYEKDLFFDDFPEESVKYQGLFINNLPSDEWNDIESVNHMDEESIPIYEGTKIIEKHCIYERSIKNKNDALQFHGKYCHICLDKPIKIDEDEYSIIEVHHIKKISDGPMYVDYKKDLIPLCSNCHALVHRLMIKYDNPIERLMVYYKNNNLTHASTL